ncbi:parB/RepB/Spo0J family partition domain protein [Chlamydia ibidis]|uniref:ParB/RepB/Spo0J family partition domain protein n=1 Tax=Chlamydia ibidis TaxID=1405396 RepID=S7J1Y1_9CHLA|nr:ParB/RepB/Spo0J family partition protein [Chlamydia ibidis]EPP34424.1 parB/RepB/Spo0J family partition domain protein [Chlamydia ibidis]EQM63099.1 ParB-like partition s domain protein [Chlamydia ibidis 10-1398/6]
MSSIIDKDTIIEVPIESIRVSPFQPRRVFSELELEELVMSIKSVGLIHPPVVREIRSGNKILYYELIAGERRWRALQSAGYTVIPVVLKQVMTDDVAAEATLIENIQRVALNPMEMAEAFKTLITVFGLTQDKVAQRVGKKRSTVANYLRLLSLSDKIRERIHTGDITLGHAKVILSLDDPQLREVLSDKIIKDNLAVRDTEREAKRISSGRNLAKATNSQVPETDYQNLVDQLSQHLGCKVNIKSQQNQFVLSLSLDNEDSLKHVIEHLLK